MLYLKKIKLAKSDHRLVACFSKLTFIGATTERGRWSKAWQVQGQSVSLFKILIFCPSGILISLNSIHLDD